MSRSDSYRHVDRKLWLGIIGKKENLDTIGELVLGNPFDGRHFFEGGHLFVGLGEADRRSQQTDQSQETKETNQKREPIRMNKKHMKLR